MWKDIGYFFGGLGVLVGFSWLAVSSLHQRWRQQDDDYRFLKWFEDRYSKRLQHMQEQWQAERGESNAKRFNVPRKVMR